MRVAIVIFVLGVASCDQDSTNAGLSNILERLKGTWKEDSSKREGLNEFLEATGVGESFRKIAKKGINWTNEKTITVNGNKVDMRGTNGPNLPGIYNNAYNVNLVADNTTIAEVDMKIMPTKGKFVVGIEGDSLVSRAINLPIVCKRTILPANPDVMIQETTHLGKMVTAKEVYIKA